MIPCKRLPSCSIAITRRSSGFWRRPAAYASYDDAEPLLIECYEAVSKRLGSRHQQTHKAITNLVELYDAWGKADKAAEWRAKLPPAGSAPTEP